MRSKFYDTIGGYKVWQRPLNKGRGFRFEVRQGNRVLYRCSDLRSAQQHASDRFDAWLDEQARYLKQMKANGEL